MRLVCISDTHTLHDQVVVPEGDMLIHAGDWTNQGRVREVVNFLHWFGAFTHPHKVLICGNHEDVDYGEVDTLIRPLCRNAGITYLHHEETVVGGLRVFGSPYTPAFCDWAFMYPKYKASSVWGKIPGGLDILVTHGPPFLVGDIASRRDGGLHVGCPELRKAIVRTKPRISIHGHVHEGYSPRPYVLESTKVYNVATCNRGYRPLNPPVIIDL